MARAQSPVPAQDGKQLQEEHVAAFLHMLAVTNLDHHAAFDVDHLEADRRRNAQLGPMGGVQDGARL